MKRSLMILPVLALLAVSPSEMESRFGSRSLASVDEVAAPAPVVEEVKPAKVTSAHPLVDKIIKSIDRSTLSKNDTETLEEFGTKFQSLKEKISEIKRDFQPNLTKLSDIEDLRERLKGNVQEVVQVEEDLKNLSSRITLEEQKDKEFKDSILASKVELESVFKDLSKNEKIVRAQEIKPEEVVVQAEAPAPKVEVSEVKAEVKEAKEEKACNHEEKDSQISELAQSQMMIMQMMMTMMQNMQMQNMYNSPQLGNFNSVYQYASPYAYNPYQQMNPGFQGYMPSMQSPYFSQPYGSSQQPQLGIGGSMFSQPQQTLQDPRMSSVFGGQVGSFGMEMGSQASTPFGFNFGV